MAKICSDFKKAFKNNAQSVKTLSAILLKSICFQLVLLNDFFGNMLDF